LKFKNNYKIYKIWTA